MNLYSIENLTEANTSLPVKVERVLTLSRNWSLLSIINRQRLPPLLNDTFCSHKVIKDIEQKSVVTIIFDVEDVFFNSVNWKNNGIKYKLYECSFLNDLSFEKVTKSKLRREIRRRKNKLEEIGDLKVQVYDGVAVPKTVIDKLFELLDLARSTRQVMSRWGLLENIDLLKKVCSSTGSLVFTVTINDECIAIAQCQYSDESRLVYMIPAFDSNYSKYSPSMLLLSHIVDYCNASDCVVDLGKGIGGYKTHFDISSYDLSIGVLGKGFIGKMLAPVCLQLLKIFIANARRTNKTLEI